MRENETIQKAINNLDQKSKTFKTHSEIKNVIEKWTNPFGGAAIDENLSLYGVIYKGNWVNSGELLIGQSWAKPENLVKVSGRCNA